MKCDNCTEKCPQEETACEIAKGRMYATKEMIDCLKKIEQMQGLLEKSAEEIENLYGKETDLTEEIKDFLSQLN